MKGFAVGTLGLVVTYVVLQPNAAKLASSGGNILVRSLKRMLSADVAGIPQRKTGPTTNPSSAPPPATGGTVSL